MGARFPAIRRLDLVERSYASGLLEQAYDYQKNVEQLLFDKWYDPMAGCLGCYLLLQSLERRTPEPADEGTRRLDWERIESLHDSQPAG
jgi:hypothetical protein